MKITVYLENPNGGQAYIIAKFDSEETYMLCVPALEAWAAAQDCIITESLDEGAAA